MTEQELADRLRGFWDALPPWAFEKACRAWRWWCFSPSWERFRRLEQAAEPVQWRRIGRCPVCGRTRRQHFHANSVDYTQEMMAKRVPYWSQATVPTPGYLMCVEGEYFKGGLPACTLGGVDTGPER